MGSLNRPSVLTLFTSVQAGIDKHITGNVTLGSVAYTTATLKAVFALAITAITAAEALHQQWTDAVASAHTAEATANALLELLRNYVISQFGKTANAVLGDFGMTAPKAPGPKTVAAKATAAAKAAATRKVRGTKGSQQKKQLKGTVEVPVTAVTTITPAAAASATTTTTPAATTAPGATAASPKPGS